MNFATFEFAVFLVCVYLPYLVMNHRQQNFYLLIASYIFYGAWDWRFLALIWFSTLVDYWVGLLLERTENKTKRRLLLMISIVTNLGMLGFFKYFGFFVDSMVDFLQLFGLHPNVPMLQIILPVGISFYTFQTMSYTIDIYRKEIKPTHNFPDFALFVAFFPQLVAGPIERAKSLLPQIQTPRVIQYEQFSRGCFLILWGLFKKIVIADGVAGAVESVYGMTSAQPTAMDIILATYLFSVQIYCDFSGYSDIARGTAKIFGFDLKVNFNLPMFATSPREYWARWHISLASWLRDYLYIPLGGSRGGEWQTQRNIFTTVFLSGVWHGGAWNFIFWGIYQASMVSIERLWFYLRGVKPPRPAVDPPIINVGLIIQLFLFFQAVNYGRMLFRAQSFDQVMSFTHTLFFDFTFYTSVSFSLPMVTVISMIFLFSLEAYQYVTHDSHYYQKWPLPLRALFYATVFFLLMAGISNATQEFIYFAF
jgi:alginate O-acetyltransferase complex protein AlgI